MLWGCQPTYPEGRIACSRAKDCPGGWVCERPGKSVARYCYHKRLASPDAAPKLEPPVDSGSADSSQGDAAPTDANPDAGAATAPREPEADAGGSDASAAVPDFHVVATNPADGDLLTDPNATLSVSFSAPVDPDTVNDASFKVIRDGISQLGSYQIDEGGVTFKLDEAWVRSGRYSVELTTKLRDRAQRPLTAKRWSFRVRDGSWSVDRISAVDTTSDQTPRLCVTSEGKAALAWTIYHSVSHARTNIVYRHVSGASWRALPFTEGTLLAVAINNFDGIAIGGEYGVALYDSADQRRLLIPLELPDRARKIILTDTDELHFLHEREGALVQTTRALQSDFSYDVVHSGLVGPFDESIAPLAGNWLAVWTQLKDPNGGVDSAVWLTDQPSCSASVGCPRMISQSANSAESPALASDPFGRSAVAVWLENGGAWSSIRATRIALSDLTWSEPQTISEPSGAASAPRVGLTAEGRALVVWLQAAGSSKRVMSALFDPSTNRWSSPVNVSGDSPHFAQHVALAVSPSGHALALWSEASSESLDLNIPRAVRSALYVPGLGWKLAPMSLSQNERVDYSTVSVGMADDGRAFASWIDDGEVWVGRYE